MYRVSLADKTRHPVIFGRAFCDGDIIEKLENLAPGQSEKEILKRLNNFPNVKLVEMTRSEMPHGNRRK